MFDFTGRHVTQDEGHTPSGADTQGQTCNTIPRRTVLIEQDASASSIEGPTFDSKRTQAA